MSTEANVNKPKHYNDHPSGVECIQIIEHMTANVAMAVKYLWRCGLKDTDTQEIGKAVWFLLREILLRGGDITELLAYWQDERYARVPGHTKPGEPTPHDPGKRWSVLVPNGLPETLPEILREIVAERSKQIVKGFGEGHDDEHDNGELIGAAVCYIAGQDLTTDSDYRMFPDGWPDWEKETDRERQLIIGITLATAELERIRRKKK